MKSDPLDLSDHDLLAGGIEDLVAENAAAARRLARLLEFHQRCECGTSAQAESHFALTPLQETVIEVGDLWGYSPGRIRSDLQRARVLATYFPGVWELCLYGHLDHYRAGIVADAATGCSDDPAGWGALSAAITPWLQDRLRHPGDDSELPELVCCTVKQLRNKLTYETTKLRPRDAEERFRSAYADRHASARTCPVDGDGMGSLTLTDSVDRIQLADYRLTLAAKAARAHGDARTLEQLRTDLAVDLILGTIAIDSGLPELSELSDGDASQPGWLTHLPTPGYARPIINVTVPIQTLMGVSDDPALLSGGAVIPATLCRMISQQPGSTWHRMLTDPAGRCMEVSTTTYKPTRSIWNDVVARYQTCFRAGCDRPAADCQLDHRVRFPEGRTSNRHLQPACERDHKGKHAEGFGVASTSSGTEFHTRAGFRHPVREAPQPRGSTIVPDDIFGFQYSATEILDALTHLAEIQHTHRHGPVSGLADIWADVA